MTKLVERCNKIIAKPISKLDNEDICTFVRQGFYKEIITPIALSLLEAKIETSGDMGKGKLLMAFSDFKDGYLSDDQKTKLAYIVNDYFKEEVAKRLIKEYGTEESAEECFEIYVKLEIEAVRKRLEK